MSYWVYRCGTTMRSMVRWTTAAGRVPSSHGLDEMRHSSAGFAVTVSP